MPRAKMVTVQLDDADKQISTNVRMLLAREDITAEHIAPLVGMTMQTVYRRIKEGGWKASEVARLALYFRRSVASMYADPRGSGPTGGLPRLDSNQEPAGYTAQVVPFRADPLGQLFAA